MNDWEGTPWAGTAVAPPPPMLPVPHDGPATAVKAATGLERYLGQPMLSDWQSTPRKLMRQAVGLYHEHPWVGSAEDTVTDKVAGLPWHIEDAEDDEVDDETPNPALQQVRDLLEKPQAAIPPRLRQPGLNTARGLKQIISRHMGLCGVAYVHPDQVDQNGLPAALIYVAPFRVFPLTTENGNLLGYRVDADDYGNGGIPFLPEELIPFYLRVPDWGAQTQGLVQRAALKARISTAADAHALGVLNRGGRTPGLISPRTGILQPEQFADLERDLRTAIDGDPDRRRDVLLRGPVDFQTTGANPEQLGLEAIWSSTKDDIFAVWGVPPSQAGVKVSRGLNGNEGGEHEYEVLMSGPVHARVVVIYETLQYELLDRWKAIGLNPQLVIEEPTFDDNATPYELASKASNQPLTWNERRAIIGLDPLPEYGPTGDPLGLAIWLPTTYSEAGQGPEEGASEENPFPNAPAPEPPPPPPVVAPVPPTPQLEAQNPPPNQPPPAKAGLGIRASVEKRVVPAIRKSLSGFLAKQRDDIVGRIRNASPRQLKDPDYWFRSWDKALAEAINPHLAGIAQTVTERVQEAFPAKADPFVDEVERLVLSEVGKRIGGINRTTRDAVAQAVKDGIAESLTADQIAERVFALGVFDDARSELIARTESMFAYNSAAITSYREYGVQKVQAIDGDHDEQCAERDGKVYTLDEAMDIEDHPNGTLDWIPVVEAA